MKKPLIVCNLILLFITGLPAQNPLIKNFTVNDGLPSNIVYQVIKDSNHFLWFATDAGVARYDGTGFTKYTKKDGLSSNDVIRMKEDSWGRIWFFNFNGTINYFYGNKIYSPARASFLDSLKSNHFYIDFFEDADSTMYFYSFQSNFIASLNTRNEVKKIMITSDIKTEEGFRKFCITVDFINRSPQNDFLLYNGSGLYKWNDFSRKPVLISDTIGFNIVYELRKNKYIFWAWYPRDTTRLLVEMIDGKLRSPVLDPVNLTKAYTDIIETDDSLLWFATKNHGVFVMKDFRVINHLAISEGQGMVQDHEGNVWITTHGNGVYRISPYFVSCNHLGPELLEGKGIYKMYPYRDEGTWMTNGKKVYLRKDSDFYTLNFSTEKSLYDQIYYLENNSLIIGKGSYEFYLLRDILPDASSGIISYKYDRRDKNIFGFKKIAIGKKSDKICFSTANYLMFFKKKGYLDVLQPFFLNERIHNSFYNRNDDLVVSARKNYLFRNGEFEPFPHLAKFNGQIITQYLPINDTVEAYLIEGDSIYLTCKDQFCNLTTLIKPGIDGQITKIDYHDEALYIATNKNIFICREPAKIHINKAVDLKMIDVNFHNINDMLVFQDSLYVATDDGLTLIPTGLPFKIEMAVPIPYIKSVQVNGEDKDISEGKLVLRGNNRLKISYGSINYSSSPLVYSYGLDESDEDWTIETATEVVYQDLGPGDYRFDVKVQKPGTDFSGPSCLDIQIKATLWQQPVFYVAIVIILCGWLGLTFQRIQRRKRKLIEMDNQLLSLEQKALQSMMNPHFIFNVLGSIQNYLLHSSPSQAGIYLSQFARLIRQNVSAINSNRISIEEEADRLRNYLELERLRLENSFSYEIEFDENLVEDEVLMIPSMIVQPYVENAVWHGIANRKNEGMIRIVFSPQSENALKIMVEDNGPGIKSNLEPAGKGSQHLHLGTQITRKRLEILGKKYGLKTTIYHEEVFPGEAFPGARIIIVVPIL